MEGYSLQLTYRAGSPSVALLFVPSPASHQQKCSPLKPKRHPYWCSCPPGSSNENIVLPFVQSRASREEKRERSDTVHPRSSKGNVSRARPYAFAPDASCSRPVFKERHTLLLLALQLTQFDGLGRTLLVLVVFLKFEAARPTAEVYRLVTLGVCRSDARLLQLGTMHPNECE
jgi:hypothetical protein